MQALSALVESIRSHQLNADEKYRVGDFGLFACTNTVRIRHVPFYQPCLILVLSGRKTIYAGEQLIRCEAGSALAIPAPSSFDLRNEPDEQLGQYKALVIPFELSLLHRLIRLHEVKPAAQINGIGVLAFEHDSSLISAIKHYLDTDLSVSQSLLHHRLMEILLILVAKNPKLLSFGLAAENWSQRVRSIVAQDLSRSWEVKDLCDRLATTESTLRRNLRKENSSFREILYELRLSTALMLLLQTSNPIYQIAYECGYQSVARFSDNFHKRFGLPPTKFRASMTESG